MKLPTGHSTWTVYFFFFNFFFHFLNWPGVLQQRKVRPYFPYSWEIRDSSIFYFFFSFSISSVLYNVSERRHGSIKFHNIKKVRKIHFIESILHLVRTWNVPITTHLIKNHLRYNFMSDHWNYFITGHFIKLYLIHLTSSKII
jgi:hypothetical protein